MGIRGTSTVNYLNILLTSMLMADPLYDHTGEPI